MRLMLRILRLLCRAVPETRGVGEDGVEVRVQVFGAQWLFRVWMKRPMTAVTSAAVGKFPRRSTLGRGIEKDASTTFSEPEVAMKCGGGGKAAATSRRKWRCRSFGRR
jgi:hypothetical protein